MMDDSVSGAQQEYRSQARIDLGELIESGHQQCAALWSMWGVPGDVVARCGSSVWGLRLADDAALSSEQELREAAEEIRRVSAQQFAELCAAAPGAPKSALEALSLAAGGLAIVQLSLEDGCEVSPESWMSAIPWLYLAIGSALGGAGVPTIDLPAFFGRIGARGANVRHSKTRELKAWALAQADTMRGAHKAVARQLAKSLPPEFAKASEDPERLIYDALRARKATNGC